MLGRMMTKGCTAKVYASARATARHTAGNDTLLDALMTTVQRCYLEFFQLHIAIIDVCR